MILVESRKVKIQLIADKCHCIECRGVGWISSPFQKLGQRSVTLEDIVGADSDIG